MNAKEAKQFVARFVTGEYTPEEHAIFLGWLRRATVQEFNEITDEQEALHERWSLSSAVPTPEWSAKLERKLDRSETVVPDVEVKRIGRDVIVRRTRWVAAASVVALIIAGGVLYSSHNGLNKNNHSSELALLTQSFSNPRGGAEKQFTLPDGSRVWLNSASELNYPATFQGNERVVKLSGEAFFDVANNPEKPFRVLIKDAKVEVIGTQFDLMAYADEPVSRTTLMEGAVKISTGGDDKTLKPGQQAEVIYKEGGSSIEVNTTVSTDAVMAWRKGYMQFKSADLRTVLREVGRCYDVEIRVEGNAPNTPYTGSMSRTLGLKKTLDQLTQLNINYKIDGKTVTITP
ncbi:MAG TPA: FecR domain-containing protein [Puia sp.]|jgi:ferric-dicitrate binding protein FerR (iron transport regulator)|nr:FecR domain-containing protein [Puia sp.]